MDDKEYWIQNYLREDLKGKQRKYISNASRPLLCTTEFHFTRQLISRVNMRITTCFYLFPVVYVNKLDLSQKCVKYYYCNASDKYCFM